MRHHASHASPQGYRYQVLTPARRHTAGAPCAAGFVRVARENDRSRQIREMATLQPNGFAQFPVTAFIIGHNHKKRN